MISKEDAASILIRSNFEVSDSTIEIIRFYAPDEALEKEPIKLLEVDQDTVPSGRVDAFAFAGGGDVPYATVIAMVTPEEWRRIKEGEIELPDGWDLNRSRSYKPEARRAG